MEKITTEQAVSILIQGCKIAQSKGAFTLEDASLVANAIKTLAPPQKEEEPTMKKVDSKKEKETA